MIIAIILAVIIIDQVTKHLALGLREGSIDLIDNFFSLVYVENRGAAFGILQSKKFILTVVTLGVITALCVFLFKHQQRLTLLTKVAMSLIIGGAIGNLIDRLFRHYVIDFFSFTLPNGYAFPVFNVADIAVVVGTFLIILAFFITSDFEEQQ